MIFINLIIMKTTIFHVYLFLSINFICISLSFSCECGIERISKRIINGHEVEEGRYPWFGRLNGCGAGLITDRHFVTSAHCLLKFDEDLKKDVKLDKKEIRLVMGIHRKEDYATLPALEVLDYITHPNYKTDIYFYDIAIIKLKYRLEFKDGLNPVCLPNFDETDNVFAYGLGKQNNENNKLVDAKVMHEVDLDRISSKECKKYYTKHYKIKGFEKREFNETLTMCSLNDKRQYSVCEGDSGSPVSSRKDGQVYVVGIPSSIDGDCLMDGSVWPTNYEKVYAHLDWIRQETKYGLYCQGIHHPFMSYLSEDNREKSKKRKSFDRVIEKDINTKKPRTSERLNNKKSIN